ncbi:hypothetical protein Plhal304r1_c034g0107201 [Plasmopara halstedii]
MRGTMGVYCWFCTSCSRQAVAWAHEGHSKDLPSHNAIKLHYIRRCSCASCHVHADTTASSSEISPSNLADTAMSRDVTPVRFLRHVSKQPIAKDLINEERSLEPFSRRFNHVVDNIRERSEAQKIITTQPTSVNFSKRDDFPNLKLAVDISRVKPPVKPPNK